MEPPQMGFVIDLKGKLLSELTPEELYRDIAKNIWTHGVLCIKNQQALTKQDLAYVASRMGEGVRLPRSVASSQQDEDFPEIIRVGNVAPSGEKMEKFVNTEVWHTDGTFFPEGKNILLSWLFPKIIAEEEGNTGYLNTRYIYSQLDEEKKAKLKNARFTTKLADLPAFKEFYSAAASEETIAGNHPIVMNHFITGEPALYLAGINGVIQYEDGTEELMDPLIEEISSKYPVYVHKWEEGDVLLWDNTFTMHRCMKANPEHRRLLIRAQSRVLPYHASLFKEYLK